VVLAVQGIRVAGWWRVKGGMSRIQRAIAGRAQQAKENVRKGRCKSGSAKDLLSDLNG